MPRVNQKIPSPPGLIPLTLNGGPSGLLPFSKVTAYRLHHAGAIEIRKLAGRRFVTAESLSRYLANLPLAPRHPEPEAA